MNTSKKQNNRQALDWLNYHHLLYFWVVAREGGLAPAGEVLKLALPTLSAQIHKLEAALGEKLFQRVGRRLVLTEMGRVVQRYAGEIFSLGQELLDTVRGRPTGQPLRLSVGAVDSVPKLLVRRLLEPALRLESPVRIVCHEDRHDRLLADLALHLLELVIADSPAPPGGSVQVFHHPLGETPVAFFAAPHLARTYRRSFPRSLDGAPLLLPVESQPLRRALSQWLAANGLRPRIVAELEDSALLKTFGADGIGIFPAPAVVAKEIQSQYGVRMLGRIEAVRERFYALTIERRIKNPAALAVCEAARAVFDRD